MITRPLILLALATPLAALPKPDPAGVVDTGPYDYGVMGPPATPAIVAEANKLSSTPLPPGPFKPEGNALYAIIPGKPSKNITLPTLAEKTGAPAISKVELLGDNGTLKHKRDAKALEVELPSTANDPLAQVLKITLAK